MPLNHHVQGLAYSSNLMIPQFGEPLIYFSFTIHLEVLFDLRHLCNAKNKNLLESASVKGWLLFRDEECHRRKELKEAYVALTEVESHQAAPLSHCFLLLHFSRPAAFFSKALSLLLQVLALHGVSLPLL